MAIIASCLFIPFLLFLFYSLIGALVLKVEKGKIPLCLYIPVLWILLIVLRVKQTERVVSKTGIKRWVENEEDFTHTLCPHYSALHYLMSSLFY